MYSWSSGCFCSSVYRLFSCCRAGSLAFLPCCCVCFFLCVTGSALTVKRMQEKVTGEKPFIVLNVATRGKVTQGGDCQPTHRAKQPAYIYLEKGCLHKSQHTLHANEGACINHSTPCLQMEACFCTNYIIVLFVPAITLLG